MGHGFTTWDEGLRTLFLGPRILNLWFRFGPGGPANAGAHTYGVGV